MNNYKHRVNISNLDGGIDVYETDGINPPTKNGEPIEMIPNPNNFDRNLPSKIYWSLPIIKGEGAESAEEMECDSSITEQGV